MEVKIKQKTCRECRCKFVPTRAIQPVCADYSCMVAYANKAAEKSAIARKKRESRQHKEKLEAIKPKSEYLKDAQRFFNQYIRARDEALPCISCGRHHQGQYHAGHYRTVGSAPHLRFSELNVHKQCAPCNNHLSGNIINYRQRLIEKIGMAAVLGLEGENIPKHYSIDDIKAIKVKYKQITKELKESQL